MQPNKLILCVLTANVLSACSSPPKLSEPKGDWVSFESTTMQMSAAPSYINVGIQQVDNVRAKQQPGIITPVLQPYSDKTLLVLSNGKNEPLYKAVRSVVPASWGIKLSPEVAQKFRGKVSWTGNDQWPYVLQRMLASAGLTSTVNDSTKEVVIYFSAPAIKPASSVLTPGKKLMNEKVIRPDATPEKVNVLHPPLVPVVTLPSAQQVPEKPKPVTKPLPVLKAWKIDKGPSLLKGFEEWVSKDKCPSMDGKWRIRKDTDNDYPVDYPLSFSSANLEDATRQLFELYKNAPAPIYVTGYTIQCLIVISDQK
ncbi:TcpQ domain-containing protein [Enterobacter cancerogenus]|nr:TcpQ domain-containing protein [Enterobacter cancerogenus]